MHDDPIQGDLVSASAGHTEAIGHRASMVTHHPTGLGSSLPCSALDPTGSTSTGSLTVPLEKLDLFSLPGTRRSARAGHTTGSSHAHSAR